MESKENHEEGGCIEEHMKHWDCCGKGHKKEFKMAILKKKEKMLEAKLEFIREIRAIMEKEPPETKE